MNFGRMRKRKFYRPFLGMVSLTLVNDRKLNASFSNLATAIRILKRLVGNTLVVKYGHSNS